MSGHSNNTKLAIGCVAGSLVNCVAAVCLIIIRHNLSKKNEINELVKKTLDNKWANKMTGIMFYAAMRKKLESISSDNDALNCIRDLFAGVKKADKNHSSEVFDEEEINKLDNLIALMFPKIKKDSKPLSNTAIGIIKDKMEIKKKELNKIISDIERSERNYLIFIIICIVSSFILSPIVFYSFKR
jgi:hypothetical protein